MGMHIYFIFICAAILNQYYGKPLYNNPCSMPYYVVFSILFMILYSLRIVRSPANSDLQENSKNISYQEILSNVLEIVQVVTAILEAILLNFDISFQSENIERI